MHIEILVEDASGAKLLEALVPKIIGANVARVTWKIHSYKGVGRIPKNLAQTSDPSKRALLNQLPRILKGYGKTPGIDAVVVVLDSDSRDCTAFLEELKTVHSACPGAPTTLFRIAIEEVEAWYFGDRVALMHAYPKAKKAILDRYNQDAIISTWEMLADAVYPGGAKALKKTGWPLPGQIKFQWAEKIGPLMNHQQNLSPSFNKFAQGFARLAVDVNPPK